jgi:N-acetylglucosaminyltransferase
VLDIIVIFVGSLAVVIIFYRYLLGLLFRLFKWLNLNSFEYGTHIEKDYSFQPVVTFTIPCYNEGSHIYQTVKTIFEQDWPKDKLEVIVVDDHSVDDTYDWALKARELGNVTVLRNNKNSGKRRSLIKATRQAVGEICISVDSDVILAPNALKELVACFSNHPKVGAVGGKVGVLNANENWITQTQEVKYFFGYELFKSTENLFRCVMCLSGCLTAYRRQALLDVEPELENRNMIGVEIKYGEDRFLTHQLVLHGWQTLINLDARCWTKSPDTLQNLFSQQLRWRRSNIIDWLYTTIHLPVHIRRVNPVVLMYYFSLALYIMAYPIMVIHSLVQGWGLGMMLVHLIILVFLAGIYQVTMWIRGEPRINSAMTYVGLGIILPISYLIITPLALFTLDSGSWETRKKQEYESEI